jgi:ABC-type transport system involved in multi-copper enzyme maturation permease subunit
MDSKILPFNKTLLKKDWKMTKWLCFVVAVILFFTMTLGVINAYNNYQRTLKEVEKYPERFQGGFDEYAYKNYLMDSLQLSFKKLPGVEPGLIIFMPMVVAALLFGEEKRKKTFEVLSTMPFTRWEIFFNKVIVAFLNIILPFLANAVIMIAALGLSKGLRDFYSTGMVMYWFGADAFRLFVILSFSLLFASLTGTSISQLVLTIIFYIFPIGFAVLINMNMSVWGYSTSVINKFLDTLGMYTMPGLLVGIEHVHIAYHLISAIVMLVASKLLFDCNKLERSGEILEFESIETFFKVGVAGCTALLMGVILTGFGRGAVPNNILTVLGYIAGIFIGWFIVSYSIKSNRAKA